MRKVIVTEFLTLDGVMEAPEEWQFPYVNADVAEEIGAGIHASEALLLGRMTYEIFAAYWPLQTNKEVDMLLFGRKTYEMMKFWSTPQAEEIQPEIARFMNEQLKVVVSHKSFEPGWSNVTVISDDVAGEIKKLKEQPGKNIAIFGSNNLCVSLMQDGLIDEFQILVNPVAFGEGTSLFKGLPKKTAFTLTETRKFKSGVISLTYEPVEK